MLTRENKIYFVWAKEVWDIEAQCCHSRWVKEETHKLSLPEQGHDSCVVLMPTRHLLKLPPLDLLICILAFSTLGVPEAHSKCCVSRHMSSHIHFWLDPEWCLLVRDEAGQPLWLLLRVEFRCAGSDNPSWKLAKDTRVNCFWVKWCNISSDQRNQALLPLNCYHHGEFYTVIRFVRRGRGRTWFY